ncbi:hypothetical protein U8527_02325 [Kordia algicida OT-1]|uniref:Uncharacterized protein n=1 Tax=Kordia algicida OT-1 TaxID=391587 RepID=A9DNA5_9FLAO|nr:hypothetical protein [Kordia algicida]EDP97147.1 hypothetical protein KAOT1_18332 [Kordia algicida OT-1]
MSLPLLFFSPILLIGIGYYFDYKDNPERFMSSLSGGLLYFLALLLFILVQKIAFNVGLLLLVGEVALFIILSLLIKFLLQKEK